MAKSLIIPPKRVRYLSEIAENNRAYDQWVKEQCCNRIKIISTAMVALERH